MSLELQLSILEEQYTRQSCNIFSACFRQPTNQVLCTWSKHSQGATLDFKWQGWLKDFGGFEIFNFGIFLDRKFWQEFFSVFKTIWRFMIVPVYPGCIVPLKFLWLRYSAWDFFGFWILPPFDHPCPLKSRVPPGKTPGVARNM